MKKLKSLLLTTALLSTLNPIYVFAEDEEAPEDEKTEEVEEAPEDEKTEEVEEAPEDEAEKENIKVDEDNEGPFLDFEDTEETEDQSIREKEMIKKPIEAPASVTGEKYNGSGTVVDFTTTGAKAFYTVKTTDSEVFYIVIDMDKTEDNVYFLSEMGGEELTFEKTSSNSDSSSVSKNTEDTDEEKEQSEKVSIDELEEETEEEGSNFLMVWIFVGVILLYVGYEFFFGKMKKKNPILKKFSKSDDIETQKEIEEKKDIHGDKKAKESEIYVANDPDEEADNPNEEADE